VHQGTPKPPWAGADSGAGPGLSFDDICALLVRDPFRLTEDRIATLTDYQLLYHYFRPRDEDGDLARGDQAEGEYATSLESMCKQVWRDRGESDAEIEAHWQRYCQREGMRVNGDGQ
jgi:hypothetical protein